MKIVTLVGNRPQFVKAAAVSRRLRQEHEELLVHSGQHYDDELSAVFFEQLDLPRPDAELKVGSASEGEQIGRIMHAFESVLGEASADLVLVYGDTNTTLAGALSAARLELPLVHVEAGMRSFDRAMPEERNRILADHLAAICLCSTGVAVDNLKAERVGAEVKLIGDVMADVSLAMLPVAERQSGVLAELDLAAGEYLLATAHRAGNVDDPGRLERLVDLLTSLPVPTVFPVHPRTRARLTEHGLLDRLAADSNLIVTAPLGYLDFVKLLAHARAVLTDSGGVQKEAYLVRTPCVTLRDSTEWLETVELGWNRLVGLDREAALAALQREVPEEHPSLYGGGHAAEGLVRALDGWAGSAPAQA